MAEVKVDVTSGARCIEESLGVIRGQNKVNSRRCGESRVFKCFVSVDGLGIMTMLVSPPIL